MDGDFWSLWWVWMAGALVLAILEVLLPGFVFLGFAAGAALVALLMLVTGYPFTLPVLFLIFAALSLVAWLLMRRFLAGSRGQTRIVEKDIND